MFSGIRSSANYKWWVFTTISIGTFLSVIDHGSVLVALPSIERHFGSDLPSVQWIVVGYALAISALILPMGRAREGDRLAGAFDSRGDQRRPQEEARPQCQFREGRGSGPRIPNPGSPVRFGSWRQA